MAYAFARSTSKPNSDQAMPAGSAGSGPITNEQKEYARNLMQEFANISESIAADGLAVDQELAQLARRYVGRLAFDDNLASIATISPSELTIDPAFFDPAMSINPAALTDSQAAVLAGAPLRFRQIFVIRHELAHRTYRGVSLSNGCFPECTNIGDSKGSMPWAQRPQEQFANRSAFIWTERHYARFDN